MNEVNIEQLQSIFGTVANIEREVKSQQRVIEKTSHVLGDQLPDITRHLTSLRDVKEIVSELVRTSRDNTQTVTSTGEKTVEELNKINTNIVSSNKEIGKNINDELNKYGTKQEQTIDKLESTLSSNFKTVSETFLSKSQEGKDDPFKTYIDNIVTVLGGKLDNVTSSISQLRSTQPKASSVKVKGDVSSLLKQQINVLQGLKTSSDKKLNSIFEAITSSNQRIAAKERKEKTTPPEINLSRKDRKLLTSLDNATKFDALLHEVKDTKKGDSKSPLMKLISPLMLLLGGVGALAFGVFKFPTVKKMFDAFTKTSMGGGIMSFFQSLGPKNKSVKEIIRNIPFVGRMVDLWDALSLMHKGNYKAGFKQLAFAIPGAEYLALLLDTSKERLLGAGYDKAGDKSVKIPFIGATAEQLFHGVFGGVSSIFEPVISFFRDGFGALGDVFNMVKPGINMNYNDIATALDSITANYFPSLKPVAEIFKSLAKSSFDWTSAKMGIKPGKEIKPINIGDMFSTVMTTITDKIATAFNSISELLSGVGMVFSSDEKTQHRGLLILDRYAPGITQGIRTFLNIMDGIKSMVSPDGTISKWKLLTTDISTEGKYSRQSSYMSVLAEPQKNKLKEFETLRKQILEQQTELQKRGEGKKTFEELSEFEKFQNIILSGSLFSGTIDSSVRGNLYQTTAQKKAAEQKLKELKERRREIGTNLMNETGIPQSYMFPNAQDMAVQPGLTPEIKQTSAMFSRMQPGNDKFQQQTETYRGYLERNRQETNKQYEMQQKLYDVINGPVINLLKESAFNGKAQVSHLEQTSKGIASLGNAPRNNVVVSSVKNSIQSFGGSNALNAKANALGAAGITV